MARFSSPGRSARGPLDPWFRLGTFDVGSAALFALLCAVFVPVWAVEPGAKPLSSELALQSDAVLSGHIWQVATWPVSMVTFGLWTVVSLLIIWFFGKELEEQIGRAPFGRLLLTLVVAFGLLGAVLGLVLPGLFLAGPGMIATAVLLLNIAEHPHRPFFFGIPGWIIACVVIAVDLISMIAYRQMWNLVHYVLAITLGALIAKRFGLLADYARVPRLGGGGRSRARRQRKQAGSGPTVVPGPWPQRDHGFRPPAPEPPPTPAQTRLDELLDKVHATGLDSLTSTEREELVRLSKREP